MDQKMGEKLKVPWGAEYYFDDVLCDWNLRTKWWVIFVPNFIIKYMNK